MKPKDSIVPAGMLLSELLFRAAASARLDCGLAYRDDEEQLGLDAAFGFPDTALGDLARFFGALHRLERAYARREAQVVSVDSASSALREVLAGARCEVLAIVPVRDLMPSGAVVLGWRAEEGRTLNDLKQRAAEQVATTLQLAEELARDRNLHLQTDRTSALERAALLRELNQRLARESSELQRMAALQDEFLAVLSHELRTPLTVIMNASTILSSGRAGQLTPDQVKLAKLVGDQVGRLTQLLDQVLETQQLDGAMLTIERTPRDVREVITQAAASVEPLATTKGLTLVQRACAEPLVASIDARRMEQVLVNLLVNAAKYTPEGGTIEIGGDRLGQEVLISVGDTGPGIAPEQAERVFEKFVRLEHQGQAGVGLGLAICKKLVEEGHGGRIWAERREPQGSIFRVALAAVPAGELRRVE